LIVGFTNPLMGGFKTYISVTSDKDKVAKDGYDNAKNNKHKVKTEEGYRVEAFLTSPFEGGDKQIIYSIADA
jgi:hypothetical protein